MNGQSFVSSLAMCAVIVTYAYEGVPMAHMAWETVDNSSMYLSLNWMSLSPLLEEACDAPSFS